MLGIGELIGHGTIVTKAISAMKNPHEILAIFDSQMRDKYARKLISDVKVNQIDASVLASSIFNEASLFSTHLKEKIRTTSPVPIADRLSQVWMAINFYGQCGPDQFRAIPGLAYAHTVTMSYISVVSLSDGLFDCVKKGGLPSTSVSKRCVKYLRENPVRAYRNAIAHGNWAANVAKGGIDFWARPGDENTKMEKWFVSQADLVFWYEFSRVVGLMLLEGIENKNDHNLS